MNTVPVTYHFPPSLSKRKKISRKRPHANDSSKQKHVTKEKRETIVDKWERGLLSAKGGYGGGKLGGGGRGDNHDISGEGVYGGGS